jgi:hypothetical protein
MEGGVNTPNVVLNLNKRMEVKLLRKRAKGGRGDTSLHGITPKSKNRGGGGAPTRSKSKNWVTRLTYSFLIYKFFNFMFLSCKYFIFLY